MRQMMMAAAVLLAMGSLASAHCPTIDEWTGRGPCVVVPSPGGGISVLKGDWWGATYWGTNVDPRGNMYGYDYYGNYWRYDRATGTYHYYDTKPTRW